MPAAADGWSSVGEGRVTVLHRGQDRLAASLLAYLVAQAPLPGLPADVPTHVTLVLAPDEESFDRATGGRIPEWGAAVALPTESQIVLPVYASGRTWGGERLRVLRHEWAHVGLHEYLDGLVVPRWFSEGYAEWAAGWDRAEAWRLRLLMATGQAPPLDSLTLGFPRDAASAGAAYLLAATAVEYLVLESGERGLEMFLRRWRETRSFEGALRATYGVTAGQFEEDWRAQVKDRYGWLLLLSQSMLIWTALAGASLLLFRVRRRRDRERLARLRAAEAPERPSFWMDEAGEGERWG